MYITAFFTSGGSPKIGLSATITVYDLSDNSKVVDGAAMSEVAEGFYKYNFTTRDVTKAYSVICDSVTLTGAERYAVTNIAESTLADVLEGTTTFIQAVRIILSAVAGKSLGFGSKNVYFRDVADSKNRITAVLDKRGNRISMSHDGD